MNYNVNYQKPESRIINMLSEGMLCGSQLPVTSEEFSPLKEFEW